MTELDYSVIAAEVLRGKVTGCRDSGIPRDEAVSLMAQAIERKASQRASRWIWGMASACAAILVVVGWWNLRASHTTALPTQVVAADCSSRSGCSSASAFARDIGTVEGRGVEPGAQIAAAPDHATAVELGSGTHLALAAGSLLSYDEGSNVHRFSLIRGSVHLRVKKLVAAERFIVETPDTKVEVRGTVFDVTWLPAANACGEQTRVEVAEGVVEVRHRGNLVRLTAGQSWPAVCAPSKPTQKVLRSTVRQSLASPLTTPEVTSAVLAPLAAGTPVALDLAKTEASAAAQRASDLAEQNDLFARASTARRAGNNASALRYYDDLLLRFPNSPLAESALSARLSLLKLSDPYRARVEAKRYLNRYPSGFSRNLAESILKEP